MHVPALLRLSTVHNGYPPGSRATPPCRRLHPHSNSIYSQLSVHIPGFQAQASVRWYRASESGKTRSSRVPLRHGKKRHPRHLPISPPCRSLRFPCPSIARSPACTNGIPLPLPNHPHTCWFCYPDRGNRYFHSSNGTAKAKCLLSNERFSYRCNHPANLPHLPIYYPACASRRK